MRVNHGFQPGNTLRNKELDHDHIRMAIEEHGGNVDRAAKAIGLSPMRVRKAGYKARKRSEVTEDEFARVTLSVFHTYGLTDKARSVAMYILSVSLEHGPQNTGRAFSCGHNTVIAAVNRVEEWRDDPGFDEELTALEQKNSPGY